MFLTYSGYNKRGWGGVISKRIACVRREIFSEKTVRCSTTDTGNILLWRTTCMAQLYWNGGLKKMNWPFGSGQGLGYHPVWTIPGSNNQLTHAKIVQVFDPPASVCFGFLKFTDTEGLSGGPATQQRGLSGQESMKTSSCPIIIII